MLGLANEDFITTILSRIVLFLPELAISLILLIIFWATAAGTSRLINRMGGARHVNDDVVYVAARTAYIAILTFGIVTALGTLGIHVAALVAGLGLTGFAVGFALKDIISNALAGLLILTYKPFQRHDRISVTALEGLVTHIDLRYTYLELPDRRVLIPNSSLFTNSIIVYKQSEMPPSVP